MSDPKDIDTAAIRARAVEMHAGVYADGKIYQHAVRADAKHALVALTNNNDAAWPNAKTERVTVVYTSDFSALCDAVDALREQLADHRRAEADLSGIMEAMTSAGREPELTAALATANRRVEELEALINNPHTDDFLQAVSIEAAHQIERWGKDHDAGKSPEDWLWVIAFLTTKATQAARYDDREKYLHHIVTTAAACLNWHSRALTSADAGKAAV